jgi:hypothetical protein
MKVLGFFSRLWRWIQPLPEGTGAEADPAAGAPPPVAKQEAREPSAAEAADGDLDVALDAVFTDGNVPSQGPAVTEASSQDRSDNRKLYADIAANFSRPIKDFILELKQGSATKEWIDVCRPVVASLLDAATSMELQELSACLDAFGQALAEARTDDGPTPRNVRRERILSLYDKLVQIQPDAFTIDEVGSQRESIIVHSLLRQIPEVGYVTIEKLYRVGLTSRETLLQARDQDLVSLAGIPLALSKRICDEVQAHQRQSEGLSPDALKEARRARLVGLVPRLRRHHEAFKQACDEVNVDRKLAGTKRDARRKRRDCALEVEVLLAEMGEVALVRRIQALAFERRIEQLEEYAASLPASKGKSVAPQADAELSPTTVGK